MDQNQNPTSNNGNNQNNSQNQENKNPYSYGTNQQNTTDNNAQNGNGYYYNPNTEDTRVYNTYSSDPVNAPKQTDTLGITAFVISMVLTLFMISCVCCCAFTTTTFVLVANLIGGIVAIVLSILSRKKIGKFTGFSLTALIVSIILIVISLVVLAYVAIIMAAFPDFIENVTALIQSGDADALQEYLDQFVEQYGSGMPPLE